MLLGAAGWVHGQEVPVVDTPLRLKPQQNLAPPLKQPLGSPKEEGVARPGYATADRIEGQVDTAVVLDGHAELRKPGVVVKADHMRYEELANELLATGAVRVIRSGDVYVGPELKLRLDDYHGYFLKPVYALSGSGREGRGQATRADFIDQDHSHLVDATYTTCTADNVDGAFDGALNRNKNKPDWYLQAATLDLDQTTQTGVGRNTVIYFKDVPILALPWVSFPLNSERQSGILPPTLGVTSNSGVEFLLPFYWNIAPNRDLTLYPKIITQRGFQLGADFRYLEPTYSGDLRYEVLPKDRKADNKDRYSFVSIHNWNGSGPWTQGWSAGWNFNQVSDDNYFVDFSRTIAASSQRTLPRSGSIAYNAAYWSVSAGVLRYQVLQDPNNPITPPYEKLPEFLLHAARLDVGGFDFNLDAQATRFWHPTQTRGDRVVVNPSISYPILSPGWFITPKLSYSATQYSNLSLPRQTLIGPTEFKRSLPTASLDSGLIFERPTRFLGADYQQTFEPRLFYVHTPYRDQSALPNFDSSLADFNFSQLFAENPFVGSDRIADADQLTLAATTRFIDAETGAERFRAAIGQRFYLSPQRVTLPGTVPVDDKKSDFLILASGETLPKLFIDSALQYSPSVNGISRSNLGLRWQPELNKVLNAEYRYVRSQIEQVDFSAQWPLTGQWYGVGRINYSTRDRKMVESVAGLEYNGCCWVLRLVAQRYATGVRTATTTFFVQLELNGLGHFGSNPLEALKRNIVGYQPINPPPPPASPFKNYE